MGSLSDVFKESMVFNSLEEVDLKKIMPLFEKWELNTGDVITTAGDIAQYFFLLESGTLLLSMEEGKSVILETPGDFMAMELLSKKGVYTTTTTALENGNVFAVSREAFLSLIQEDTPGAETIMQAWQEFCSKTAAFAENIVDINVPGLY
ncbi:MAG: hypothetical protein B6230_03845 [Desulfobacteraceae bacterium 4572_89]|nr:MAG: hypothetical protein B6230_03845 [Desulfobacteraceae bacterium 4572_89]